MERSEHGNRSYNSTDYPFPLLCFLKLHTYTRVQVSIDICGVDHPSRKQTFEVVHNLLSTRYNSRIRVQTSTDEVTRISPIVSPFPSAGRWEREVWDMSGVSSINHLNLHRISTDHGFKAHPLRKDFPLSGYVEVRYDDPRGTQGSTMFFFFTDPFITHQIKPKNEIVCRCGTTRWEEGRTYYASCATALLCSWTPVAIYNLSPNQKPSLDY